MKISVIIPVFNEEKSILECLESLDKQSIKDYEVILVDDGSNDKTLEIVKDFEPRNYLLKLLTQNHLGPGLARNLGAKQAKGRILVFVDADMVFDEDFLKKLIQPIEDEKSIGTFSKEEYLLNKKNVWSKCWNLNKGLPANKMHGDNYPDKQKVFRAILKNKFELVGGFTPVGYVDDYTISEKLGEEATVAKGAIFYHRNPESLKEVFSQARWIGKSEYKKRKIKNENIMRLISIIRYSLPFSLIKGLYFSIKYKIPSFILFKTVYDFAIEVSLIKSFFGEQIYK